MVTLFLSKVILAGSHTITDPFHQTHTHTEAYAQSYYKFSCSETLFCYRIYVCRLCGLVVRVLGYRPGGPGSIPGTTRKKIMGLERSPLSLVSTTEELLDRKV
jgi:hypothetical protein